MFRMRAWVPVGALGRLPWGPGVVGGGGVGGPNYQSQRWAYDFGCKLKIDVDFDLVFCSSWGRLGLRLGAR